MLYILALGLARLRVRHIGEHTVLNTYVVRQSRQIRLFDLEPSANPIFVLNRHGKSDLYVHISFRISKLRVRHIGEHTVLNTYVVRQSRQIRLFDLEPSDNPTFVLNRSVKFGFMLVLALGLVSECAGTLVSTQYLIPKM